MTTNEKELKGLFYNIYNGGGPRLDAIAKFVRKKDYSFVAFSELNAFTEKSFAEWAALKLELKYAEFLETPHGFHLGIASRYKIKLIKHETGYPFHHGYILARIEELEICLLVTHLCPFTAVQRLEEANELIKALSLLNVITKPLMLVGDLNTLSCRDDISDDSMQLLAKNARLKKKFLKDENDGHLSVDIRPMETLLQELIDIGMPNDYSVPTNLLEDKMHATEMRLDYCLISKALFNACHGQVHSKMIKSAETAELSDHYPVEIFLKINE